jgi:hypothetical protein
MFALQILQSLRAINTNKEGIWALVQVYFIQEIDKWAAKNERSVIS